MEHHGGESWQVGPDTRAGGSLDVAVAELLEITLGTSSNKDQEEAKDLDRTGGTVKVGKGPRINTEREKAGTGEKFGSQRFRS